MGSPAMHARPAGHRTAAPVVRRAAWEEILKVADTIAVAFFDDPVNSWVLPDAHSRVKGFRDMLEIMIADDWFRHDLVFCTEGIEAAAIWVPPEAPELSEEQTGQMVSRLAQVAHAQTLERSGVLDAVLREHPHESHYYLPLLGVRPERQSRGLGSALLAHMTRRCDAERMPAYLEATSPRSRPLYERHGFKAVRELPIPGGPTLQAMWRAPRRGQPVMREVRAAG